jgi:shikimate dehydrogenase
MNLYALIGYPLTHSFSKKYFSDKFIKEGLSDYSYELFEIKEASELPALIEKNPALKGLNVTIPHKEAVIPLLNELDSSAKEVGAVNVIRITADGYTIGYNSDYYGFKLSLLELIGDKRPSTLVLGTGGAAKAVKAALHNLGIHHLTVSRNREKADLSYADLDKEILDEYTLIINTTPLGTYPAVDTCPNIPYEYLSSKHILFDLVYNPAITLFLQKGLDAGAQIKNGLQMLHLQAEKAWEIWQQK